MTWVNDTAGRGVITRGAIELWKRRAVAMPWTGQRVIDQRLRTVTTALTEPGRATSVLFTFDVGYHSSGWWKNAEYERCWHLSLTHPTGVLGGNESPADAEVRAWAEAFFVDDATKAWIEPPASTLDPHRLPNVAHVRVFVDEHGQAIIPEGEVYALKPWPWGKAAESIGGDVR